MKALLKENTTGKEACYKTIFKFKKGLKYLRFSFKAFNSTFNSYSNKYNDPIFNGDVCEIFIRYGKENHHYEIEVAPNNTIFLADITNINDKFSRQLIEKCFLKTSTKILKNKYFVKIKIPKSKIKTSKIQFNACRIETDGEKPEKHLFALHPTMCDSFHINKSIY